ncbi:Predicted kinase, aminoglycoside phosphotransferase (APT) family [Salinihabitans flavidus]|uniref:Predicted kinase, aminoglycoside phosphotransferase (APT) family n=1 Tax=Salinihabitans flavidus TaxID=569882 RepID=A0A1H8V7N2_9RHOB|nr:phosphotransferase family protein [Salinihabitans flavidus]SEP11416.1 Predicted kinase, aminoglycoside phosphotransferase (APT) family [Salinihabitans flavidus]
MSSPAVAGQDTPVFDPYDSDTVRAQLLAFLGEETGARVEVRNLTRFTVGFSWVTYGFRAAWNGQSRDLILRIGPPRGIFAPYLARPEFVTLKTLRQAGMKVPDVYWYDDSGRVFGAPFFICEWVAGDVPIPWTEDGKPAFDEGARRTLGAQFFDILADLHNFDWRTTEVAELDAGVTPETAATGQIDAWVSRMRGWSEVRYPMLEWAAAWFHDHAPVAQRVSIVHGDFRIGNFLETDGQIQAFLDWELVHLGDPLEDLGWTCMRAWRGRSEYMCHLLTRDALLERYCARTGLEVTLRDLAYWEAFGTFKLAIMHLAAFHCFEKRGFNDMRMAGMGAQIPRMLLQVEKALEEAQ